MELLWGLVDAPTRGPKQGLSVAGIVAAAIELVDAEGLAALSMRRVGERFGKTGMSLYTYVPGKAELLDLMLDTALGELRNDYPLDAGWRPALEAAARDLWELYRRHPWMLRVSVSRLLLGPHELDAREAQLRLLDGLGLTGTEMTRTINLIVGYVRGAASALADAMAAEQHTGMSDDDWWYARTALLAELLTADRFPLLVRLTQATAGAEARPDGSMSYSVREAQESFEFGLQQLLDGIGTRVGDAAGPRAGRGG